MINCDICGKETNLVNIIISGTELEVCSACSEHGQIMQKVQKPEEKDFFPKKRTFRSLERSSEPELYVVNEFNKLIKLAREKAELTQKEVGQNLAEKESLIQKIESGQKVPSIATAKKFEKFFRLKLIEEMEEQKKVNFSTNTESSGLTLGDFIKRKEK